MAKKDDVIERIDASFEEVVNAIMPKTNAGQKPNPMIGSPMKVVKSLPASKDLTWSKKLSRTDAQQKTKGGLVQYLRITNSNTPSGEDFQVWFRTKFFAGLPWKADTFGKEAVESCYVPFDVTFQGVSLGSITFHVTHGPHRYESNNAPNTWIHWPDRMQKMLAMNDLSGKPVKITRDASGMFSMKLGS